MQDSSGSSYANEASNSAVRRAGNRDPYRLHAAPDRELVTAAAVLAKGLVLTIEAGGLRAQKAAALKLIDNAGRATGQSCARRTTWCPKRSMR
jgi:hypothetical protein